MPLPFSSGTQCLAVTFTPSTPTVTTMFAMVGDAEITASALQTAAMAIHAVTVILAATLILPGFGGPLEVCS